MAMKQRASTFARQRLIWVGATAGKRALAGQLPSLLVGAVTT